MHCKVMYMGYSFISNEDNLLIGYPFSSSNVFFLLLLQSIDSFHTNTTSGEGEIAAYDGLLEQRQFFDEFARSPKPLTQLNELYSIRASEIAAKQGGINYNKNDKESNNDLVHSLPQ